MAVAWSDAGSIAGQVALPDAVCVARPDACTAVRLAVLLIARQIARLIALTVIFHATRQAAARIARQETTPASGNRHVLVPAPHSLDAQHRRFVTGWRESGDSPQSGTVPVFAVVMPLGLV
jgi:hypothetical protein